jgi:hypothetical protein
MTYTKDKPPTAESSEQLRARIPGWGADLDPRDRPAVPRERFDPGATGAHWDFPDRQPELAPRERSIEHKFLTPVFGTSAPRHGLSGALRTLSYARYSEGRAAHWLLLIAADRVDVVEHVGRSLVSRRPENPLLESGLRSEVTGHGLRSRTAGRRADVRHHPLDPIVVAGPWLLGAWVASRGVRAVTSRRGER